MTKEQALYSFWSSFKISAYEENSVPTGADFPYITYQIVTDSFGGSIAMSASVWYRSTSLVNISNKTEEISTAIGRGGKLLMYDGGAIWLKRGTPFVTTMGDNSDDKITRNLLNITAEYISAD